MRSQFAFYKSFDDVYQDLNNNQKLEFINVLLDVQFLRVKINDVEFKDNILKHIWNAQKHSIEKSIKGYIESQKNQKIKEPFLGVYDCLNIPSEGICEQEKEKEKGEGEEQGEEQINAPAKASASDNPPSPIKQSNADLFEIIWKVYSLEFINKKVRPEYGSKADSRKKFNTIMKHKFKGIKMEDIQYVLTDYIDDNMEKHKHNLKYAKNLSNILTVDDIQDYINIESEKAKDN